LVTKAHQGAIDSGLFSTADIKTRAYPAAHYIVAEGNKLFVHVTLYLLEGRTVAQKQHLSEALSKSLLPLLKSGQHLSIDIRDLLRDIYKKHVA